MKYGISTVKATSSAAARQYLRDVNFRSFGSGHHHGLEVIKLGERLLGGRTGLVSGFVEDFVHLIFEGLTQSVTGSRLQFVVVSLLDNVNYLIFREGGNE